MNFLIWSFFTGVGDNVSKLRASSPGRSENFPKTLSRLLPWTGRSQPRIPKGLAVVPHSKDTPKKRLRVRPLVPLAHYGCGAFTERQRSTTTASGLSVASEPPTLGTVHASFVADFVYTGTPSVASGQSHDGVARQVRQVRQTFSLYWYGSSWSTLVSWKAEGDCRALRVPS